MKYTLIIFVFIILHSTIACVHLRSNSQNIRKTHDILEELAKVTNLEKFVPNLKNALTQKGFLNQLRSSFKTNNTPLKCTKSKKEVSKLIPLQKEIGLSDSLKFVFKNDVPYTNYFSTEPILIGAPVITLNGNQIIDGHHRWSQLYLVNPDAIIQTIDCISSSASVTVLKQFHASIAALEGNVPSSKVGEKDIYEIKENEIKDYLTTIVPLETENIAITDDDVKEKEKAKTRMTSNAKLTYFIYGLKKKLNGKNKGFNDLEGKTDRDKVITYLYNAVKNFPQKKTKRPSIPC